MSDVKEEVVKEMRVAGSTNAKELAIAIFSEFNNFKCITLTAIGLQSINQTVKAIAIAGGLCGQKAKTINTRIGFTEVSISGDMRTAIIFTCRLS
jgi:stage V sporulation protein SpoVS